MRSGNFHFNYLTLPQLCRYSQTPLTNYRIGYLMDDPISIDEPPHFNAEDWIGRKKQYSTAPYFVRDACLKAFAIPTTQVAKLFPGPDITVADLLKKELPPRSSAIISSKLESWFSKDVPHTNFEHYFTRPIPNDAFVDELHKIAGQAWLDGANSIADQRFDLQVFRRLCNESEKFKVATKLFSQRGKNKAAQESGA
jgi:hypothetical protein